MADLEPIGREMLITLGRMGSGSGQEMYEYVRATGLSRSQPTVYEHLTGLADEGLVDKEQGNIENKYTVTESGRVKLEQYAEFVGE